MAVSKKIKNRWIPIKISTQKNNTDNLLHILIH